MFLFNHQFPSGCCCITCWFPAVGLYWVMFCPGVAQRLLLAFCFLIPLHYLFCSYKIKLLFGQQKRSFPFQTRVCGFPKILVPLCETGSRPATQDSRFLDTGPWMLHIPAGAGRWQCCAYHALAISMHPRGWVTFLTHLFMNICCEHFYIQAACRGMIEVGVLSTSLLWGIRTMSWDWSRFC